MLLIHVVLIIFFYFNAFQKLKSFSLVDIYFLLLLLLFLLLLFLPLLNRFPCPGILVLYDFLPSLPRERQKELLHKTVHLYIPCLPSRHQGRPVPLDDATDQLGEAELVFPTQGPGWRITAEVARTGPGLCWPAALACSACSSRLLQTAEGSEAHRTGRLRHIHRGS